MKRNFVRASELGKLQQALLEERDARGQALAAAAQEHKDEIAAVQEEAHRMKVDNLLSVGMERLQAQLRDVEERYSEKS